MKRSIIITSFTLVAVAGFFFAFALFATPAQAGILDGNFDCFPLPACPEDHSFDCFPLPFCPRDNDDHDYNYGTGYRGTTVVNCYKQPNRCAQPQSVGRSTYAEPNTPSYSPIQVSCQAENGTVRVGDRVTWTAHATGGYGAGSYTFNWRDSDGVTGSGQTFNRSYGTPSFRSAQVTVHSGGMQVTQDCGSVNVYQPSQPAPQPTQQPQPVYVPPQQTNTNNNTNNNNNSNRNTNNIYINGIPYSQYQAQAQTFYQPTYSYGYEYPQYHYYAGPLSVTCSADTTYTTVGNTLRWRAFVTGGYGNPIISWTGTDGLTGYGQTVAKSYAYPGQKGATVTVTSGGQVTSAYCAPVTIGGPVVYQPPYQAPLPPAYPPAQSGLDIACYATPTKIKVGQTVTWTADARGGAAPFRYSWTGTDGLVSTQRSVSKTYYSAGTKKATVTVTSADGRSTTRNCGVTVSVTSAVAATSVKGGKEGSSVAQAPVYTPPQYQGPQYYDPLTGQPLPPGVQPFPVNEQPTSTQSASLFSIKNISWGWVSFLVILVLFVTVIYLIFNKNKV